ncbi:MAG TPA: NACHT domain-containing protein [Trebonia sp.]
MTARAWRQVLLASAAPGYGFRYRRWLLDSLQYIDVRDLATGGDHIPELGDVFVDVALVSRAPQQPSSYPLSSPAEKPVPEATAAPDPVQRHSLSALLGGRSRVVLALVGQPGSGKSTLLAQAARRSAQWPGRGRLGRNRVPLLLALHEQAETITASPTISLSEVARAGVGGRAGREPHGWWERQLRRGRCLVLLDGLDEVAPAADRLTVAGWVERQIAAYPRAPFVVTSRPYGLPDSLAAQADVYVVRPFTAGQVQLFLDRWYLAAERHATGASGRAARRAVRVRARESAARLAAALREHPALYDLSVNPLLLTMIATAHRYRGALPASRADLYGEICRVLLSRRGQSGELPELLSWPAKQTLLAVLAYQMMRDHVGNLPAARVLEILSPLLERFPASVTGESFLDEIARNGLLVEAPAGRYAFSHLTFQEYLAARHVSATPDLVKILADNVDDPWWHEAILLYAATADASPVVRACLDSGTIPALTLAFDCSEAGSEVDPDLRRHLDRERQRAFEPGCPAGHRRLIAGVQAARLVRRTHTTAAGIRVCAAPVPADLYWLFLADTQAPQPDRPCPPEAGQPARGMWGTEAQAFVTWLNSITATATGIEVRLPRHDELQEETIAGALGSELPAAVTSAWTQPGLGLWLRRGQPHPHELPGSAIRQAVTADAGNTALLSQILTAAVLDVVLRVIRDLEDVRALGSALADDLAARANSDGQLVDLMHAHIHAIVRAHTHALRLTRADAITRTCAAEPELVAALGLAPARALADAIAGDVAAALGRARGHAVELADAIDLDLSVLSAFDFDITRAFELGRVHNADLDRAHVLARGTLHAPGTDLAAVFGLASVGGLDPALPLPGILGLPLRWVADGPLAATVLQVLAAKSSPAAAPSAAAASPSPSPDEIYLAFALALTSGAGLQETSQLRAALGNPLTGRLSDLTEATARKSGRSPDWSQATVLGRLTGACGPISGAHQSPGPAEAAALRAVSLALAGGTDRPGADAADVLRTVAATVTVVQNRHRDGFQAGESVILALV